MRVGIRDKGPRLGLDVCAGPLAGQLLVCFCHGFHFSGNRCELNQSQPGPEQLRCGPHSPQYYNALRLSYPAITMCDELFGRQARITGWR